MAHWYDNEYFVKRVQTHLDWFHRNHDGILGIKIVVTGKVTEPTKHALFKAKYYLGYPDAQILWGSGVDEDFIHRLHHPTYKTNPIWVVRGLRRRRQYQKSRAVPNHIGRAGISLITSFEGYYGRPYRDPVGVWTIGYGHTGSDVFRLGFLTEPEARLLLARDLIEFEDGVKRYIKVPLNQNQFDALVSFSYNVGVGALAGSTLRAKLNRSDYRGASAEFDRWVLAGGRVFKGLVRRRNAEQALFNKPI